MKETLMHSLPAALLTALLASSAMAQASSAPASAPPASTAPAAQAVSATQKQEIQDPSTCIKVNDLKLKVFANQSEYTRKTVSWRMTVQNSCTKTTGFAVIPEYLDKDGFELPATRNLLDIGQSVAVLEPGEDSATGTFGVSTDTFNTAATLTMKFIYDKKSVHKQVFKIDDIYPDRLNDRFQLFQHTCFSTEGMVSLKYRADGYANVTYNLSPRARCLDKSNMTVYARIRLTSSNPAKNKTIDLGKFDQQVRGEKTFNDLPEPKIVFEISPDTTWKTSVQHNVMTDVEGDHRPVEAEKPFKKTVTTEIVVDGVVQSVTTTTEE